MKQVIQDLRTHDLRVADVPPPVAQRGRVLVRTAASLISAGTERMTVEMGNRSLLGKARERPDLVKQVIHKAQTEGVLNTLNAVRAKLDSVTPLGYSASGIVIGAGEDVTEFRPGDRVACAGAGYASHAEVLSVPRNLCVRLPENVDFARGAFGTLGAIALQGLRLASPTLGESCVVIGLGLVGQLTVQLLKANGCRVFGIDLDKQRIELARQLGADDGCAPDNDAERRALEWSRGRGADAVLITAATSSNQPVELAGAVSRLKGRVVAVGLVGLDIPRDIYYHKELTLNISMSYGPGRYDAEYEERGHDYPFAYVRWTEGRNLEAFLDLVAAGNIRVESLITHRFSIADAERAYQLITGEVKEPYLGVLLEYDTERALETRLSLPDGQKNSAAGEQGVTIGLIGAGSYAKKFLLPNFKAAGARFQTIATASGLSAREVGEKYGFRFCVSGAAEVLDDEDVNLIVIATRHDTHAELARRALERGRHVFVEKPLALNDEELESVLAAAAQSDRRLMAGFNRRFSPLARAAKDFFQDAGAPLSINYRVNAGRIPHEHWIQDPREGGGRIIGEVCHFIDLMQFLTGAVTTRVYAEAIAGRNHEMVNEDSVFITLRFADGSNGSIAYLAEGDKTLPKERIEVFGAGKSFVIDDFRSATLHSSGKEKTVKLRGQDKGQANEVREVCRVVLKGGSAPIALDDLAATTRATFRILESLRTSLPVEV
ncbi:MAG: bi-domain-containing oxidoreductase [Pyrinomonadaceae bacterium]